MSILDNAQLINLAKTYASTEFNERIPLATKNNVSDIGRILSEYPTAKNEFINILTNQIGKSLFDMKVFENPFAFMDEGVMEYGKSIEEYFFDIIKGKSFGENTENSEASEVLEKVDMSNMVKVQYYSENFRHKYKITISDSQLKGAFRSQNGLDGLIRGLIQGVINSFVQDQYLLCRNALCKTVTKEEVITGYDDLSENEQAKAVNKLLRALADRFNFVSNQFNTGGLNTFSTYEDMIIFVTPETKALIDVELLADTFNMEKADVRQKIKLIDTFVHVSGTGVSAVDNNTLAIICDKKTVRKWTTQDSTGTMHNPNGLYYNTFYHKWGIVSGCPYVNAVRIKKQAS